MREFNFGGSKITADGKCSHEIERCLLIGRKAMTNLDSILKNRDITLSTKFRLVKATVFPAVLWELDYKESWVPKNWCFWTVVLEKTLESPLDCKEIQPVNPKGNQTCIFIRRTHAESDFEYFGHLMWTDSFEKTLVLGILEGQRRGGWQRMRWLDGIIALMDMNLIKLLELVMDNCWWCSLLCHRVRHNWATELTWTNTTY